MRFRADKNAVGHIEAESAAYVGKEVVAALEIGTPGKVAGEKWLIKAEALNPNSALQIRLHPLAQRRTEDSIEIIQNRPVRIEKDIYILVAAPGHFSADPEIFLDEEKVTTESRIPAAADALRSVVRTRDRIGSRLPGYGTHAEGEIKLLSVCSAGTQ